MKLILSAGSLYTLPLPKAFEIARDVGFDGVEVIINHDFEYSQGKELLAEVCQIHPVAALHAPFFDINGWGNQIKQLEKDADKAKDVAWMRAEMQKARKKAKGLEEELAQQQARVAELEALPEPLDPAATAQSELADLRLKNADLEQRLAATLLVNSQVDLMAESSSEPVAEKPAWGASLPSAIGGFVLGTLLGAVACYRWFENRIRGRYVRVY